MTIKTMRKFKRLKSRITHPLEIKPRSNLQRNISLTPRRRRKIFDTTKEKGVISGNPFLYPFLKKKRDKKTAIFIF
jgi:hypothetical protein